MTFLALNPSISPIIWQVHTSIQQSITHYVSRQEYRTKLSGKMYKSTVQCHSYSIYRFINVHTNLWAHKHKTPGIQFQGDYYSESKSHWLVGVLHPKATPRSSKIQSKTNNVSIQTKTKVRSSNSLSNIQHWRLSGLGLQHDTINQ